MYNYALIFIFRINRDIFIKADTYFSNQLPICKNGGCFNCTGNGVFLRLKN